MYAFYNCSSLTSIIIPDGITGINEYTFYNCSSLVNLTIPDSAKSIGEYAFYDCSSLKNVKLSKSLTHIYERAFMGCKFTSIIIPNSVICIRKFAFGSGLESVFFENTEGWKVYKGSPSTTLPTAAITGLEDPATAAEYLSSYNTYWWERR